MRLFLSELGQVMRTNPIYSKIGAAFIGVVLVWTVFWFVKKKVAKHIDDNGTRYHSKKLIGFAGWIVAILMVTVIFSDQLGSLTVAFGVAGAGIAFALQEIIVSMAGWIAIVLGGAYKTGDRIQLGGIKGDVIDIGILRTTIMETGQWVDGDLYNGRMVFVTNSFVFKEPVFNYSGEYPFLWDEIKIPICYGADYEMVRELFSKIAHEVVGDISSQTLKSWKDLVHKYLIEDAQTQPMVTLAANDNWVEYTIRYVVIYKKRRFTKDRLFSKILKEVESSNGKIKFASATFALVEAPPLQVKLKDNQ